ncbi:hypothetical protein BU16DRAFT_229669 [Lophium mytilinum]|uniref:Blastomyces yeast-phase-specific protein n=1 Tax=Lophium mytilinum TaxID=390894 RepID=A0A6A6Q9K7_9PEZI|nr:hypothetical protein BU16DRAFT_229669 [Lophium mytilinum]
MHFLPLLTTALLPLTTLALGGLFINNNCYSISPPLTRLIPAYIAQSDTYTRIIGVSAPGEQFHHAFQTGHGVSIQVADHNNGPFDGSPLLEVNYAIDEAGGLVYYDLVNVNGALLEGYTVVLKAPAGCGSVRWPEGVPEEGEERVGTLACGSDAVLALDLCKAP